MFKNIAALGSLLVVTGFSGIASAPASAQSAASTVPVSGSDAPTAAGLDEIVVTAQRRSEKQVDVPISIAAIGQEQLAAANVQSLGDIQQLTPALRFDNQSGFTQPSIRGIGTNVTTSGGGSNVGIYINGFYSPNPLAADFQLMNVSSVQVLKGPQGTLFGHNTTGGAILVTTPDPSTETHAEAKVSYGSFNAQRYQGYATTGLFGEYVAADVEGIFSKGHGFLTNIANGDDHVGAYQDWTVRGGLKINFSDRVSALLRYTDSQSNNPTSVDVNSNVDPSINPTTGLPWGIQTFTATGLYTTAPNRIAADLPNYFTSNTHIAQATVKADLSFADLTSYSQWRKEDVGQSLNQDMTALPLLQLGLPIFDKTLSQEFLLSSKPGPRLQWTAGGFFFSNTDTYVVYLDNFVNTLGRIRLGGSSSTDKNYAGYLDATYELTPQWFLTAGVRYSDDVVTNAYYNPSMSNQQIGVPGISGNKTTPRVVLRYKPTPDSSIYASYTEGYKAAIIDVGGSCQDSFDNFKCNNVQPEDVKAYEVGYKIDTRRFSSQSAAFYYDYKNLQVSEYLGNAQAFIINAAKSEIYGLEEELHFDVNDHVQVNGGASWTHARYITFGTVLNGVTIGAPIYASCPPQPNTIPGCASPINYDYVNTDTIIRGAHMQHVPTWTANIAPRLTTGIMTSGEYSLTGNFYYTSQYWSSPSGTQFLQPSYATVALRAEWKDPSRKYTVALYGDNLTNERYRTSIQYTGEGIGATWNQPASWGIELGAKF
jgi:iron complex outermembrane receptor protein